MYIVPHTNRLFDNNVNPREEVREGVLEGEGNRQPPNTEGGNKGGNRNLQAAQEDKTTYGEDHPFYNRILQTS